MHWDGNAEARKWGRKRRVRGMHKVFTADTSADNTTTTTTSS
jgi:hypothetical protein